MMNYHILVFEQDKFDFEVGCGEMDKSHKRYPEDDPLTCIYTIHHASMGLGV